MKKLYTLLALAFTLSAQLTAQTVLEHPGPRPVFGSTDKPEGVAITCSADTVRYFESKATSLRFLSVNAATSAQGLCQYYDCPQPITIHGMEVYGYAESGIVNTVCQLYLAGPDSLPVGSPLATDTVPIDTYFGTLTLNDLRRTANFSSPVLVTKPYVLVYDNFTAVNTVMVTTDFDSADGVSEWMAGGDFRNMAGGDWTRSYDMNVGAVPFNADALINPIASYENTADFSADKTCLTGPTSVTFTDYCLPIMNNRMYNSNVALGVPDASFGWQFGDGSPTTYADDPTHPYAGTGPYNVTLYATMQGWTSTCIENSTVTIGGTGKPIAAFNPMVSGAMVDFMNYSSGATTVAWNFGDGGVSSATSPTHWYTSNGTYVAMLIVSNACGSDTLLKSITISCDFADAGFSYTQPSGTLLTAFTDTSSGDVTGYLWDFGDGWTSTLANPYHTYPAYGDYIVTLIIISPCGNDTLVDTVTISAPVFVDPSEATQLAMFPNPAQDQVTLVGLPAGAWRIQITDLSGRVLTSSEAMVSSLGQARLNVEQLPRGTYLVTGTQADQRRSALLVISR